MARRKPADDEDDDDAPKKKKKPARKVVVEDEPEDDDLEDYSKPKKAGENAYTGLLAIAFLGLAGAAVLLFLDYSELNEKPIPAPTMTLPALGATAPAAPATPPAPEPGN